MENPKKDVLPPQHQNEQPGKESWMEPRPQYDNPNYRAAGKLQDKVAIITGGDSGIGRAVALAYAKEGADVVILYLNQHEDAAETEQVVMQTGRRCLKIAVDLKQEQDVLGVFDQIIKEFGKIDILVNNAGVQYPQNCITDITKDQLFQTFETNIFSMFYVKIVDCLTKSLIYKHICKISD